MEAASNHSDVFGFDVWNGEEELDWGSLDHSFDDAFSVAAVRSQGDDDQTPPKAQLPPVEAIAVAPLVPPTVVETPVHAEIKPAPLDEGGILGLPRRLCAVSNLGDLDALRALIESEFTEDCLFKTCALEQPLRGREFIFRFYAALLEKHPDGFLIFQRSFLDRTGNCIFKCVYSGTTLGTDHAVADSFLFANPKECHTVGWLAKQIIEGTRRYFFASEKQNLLKKDRRITEGKGLARIELHVVGKHMRASGANSGKIGRVELSWKFKALEVVSVK